MQALYHSSLTDNVNRVTQGLQHLNEVIRQSQLVNQQSKLFLESCIRSQSQSVLSDLPLDVSIQNEQFNTENNRNHVIDEFIQKKDGSMQKVSNQTFLPLNQLSVKQPSQINMVDITIKKIAQNKNKSNPNLKKMRQTTATNSKLKYLGSNKKISQTVYCINKQKQIKFPSQIKSKQKKQKNQIIKTSNKNKYKNKLLCIQNQNIKINDNQQKQVINKINDLKIKKKLCQIQQNYLSSCLKINVKQIKIITDINTVRNNQENMLENFILKSIAKFLMQFQNQLQMDCNKEIMLSNLDNAQNLLKVMNKLPELLRVNNVISQVRYGQFFQEKNTLQQKLMQLGSSSVLGRKIIKGIFYNYLNNLHNYIQFLLKNSMVYQTKINRLFQQEEIFSEKSCRSKNTHQISSNKQHQYRSVLPLKITKTASKNKQTQGYDSSRKKNNRILKINHIYPPKITLNGSKNYCKGNL